MITLKTNRQFRYLTQNLSIMPAKLALMLEITRKKKYTDGLKIFRSQDLFPVSLETRIQYGGDEITRLRLNETRFDPKKSRPQYISVQKISTLF